ncbi:tRNA lysidine(34) synthetase TilS [Roseateles violae]|uniref:tRNA(Ile)-lysidine synthase n=1 Tax=Roseateles violae TaxID=3058042 RepID=A0ABT8DY18_9BURK|nr:tRNA lysidine(34) synthetase TilS [Pelomonas sp. PFR6]MDN3922022.1 tRNA lysidine(34) synthetase TilS [Pelomonas sp. PFR6]
MAVAYSGGRDSTALLHATAMQARELGLEVLALHVHHGLSVHADAWLLHCEGQCAAWVAQGLPLRLQWRRLTGQPAAAESIEAWAREGRYAALAEMAREAGTDLLLLAQHRRDQAETLLLQALRGAGAAGLAGMPAQQWREGLCWARPWVDQPREAIEAYIAEHALQHIEDDSNSDPRHARNRLRLAVWPSLTAAFPQAEASLAQSAGWAQQALALLQEIADEDLRALGEGQGLDLLGLQALSPARASNALRAWLQRRTGQIAPASLIRRLAGDEARAGQGAWPCAGGWLRLYRGRLSWSHGAAAPPPPSQIVKLDFAGMHAQPDWGGAWRVEPVMQGGVAAGLLQDLTLRARQGGEQFQRAPRSTARSLKKAYQEAGVPAWQREGPLLFAGERLLFAAGLGIDARMLAAPGQAQFGLRWLPDPATD